MANLNDNALLQQLLAQSAPNAGATSGMASMPMAGAAPAAPVSGVGAPAAGMKLDPANTFLPPTNTAPTTGAAPGPGAGMLPGMSRSVISQNIQSMISKGVPEQQAVQRALAFAHQR
jgi:hypothetical protein